MWLKELKTHASPDIKIFLIGNKIDLEDSRKVTTEEAKKFQTDYELNLYMETSAKTGFNAQNLFMKAGTILYDEHLKNEGNISRPGSILQTPYLPEVLVPENEEENNRKNGCFC